MKQLATIIALLLGVTSASAHVAGDYISPVPGAYVGNLNLNGNDLTSVDDLYGYQYTTDTATSVINFTGQDAYPGATGANRAGGDIYIAGGNGSTTVTISDFSQCGGAIVDITVDGVLSSAVEGIDWTAATSNAITCAALDAAVELVSGVAASTVCSGAALLIVPSDSTLSITAAIDIAGCGAAYNGTDGSIYLKNATHITGAVDITGNIVLNDPGTSANSYSLTLFADSAGTAQGAQFQVVQHATDPYLAIVTPDSIGAPNTVMKLYDNTVAVTGNITATTSVSAVSLEATTGAATLGGPLVRTAHVIADDVTSPDVSVGNWFTTSANTVPTTLTGLTGSATGQTLMLCGGGNGTNDTVVPNSAPFTLKTGIGAVLTTGTCINLWVRGAADYVQVGPMTNVTQHSGRPTITSSGTADFGTRVQQTLNDPTAAGGSDRYDMYRGDLTATNVTGYNTVNLLGLTTGAADRFTVSSAGVVTAFGSYIAPIFQSSAADPADTGVARLANAEQLCWEKATPGTDLCVSVTAGDAFAPTGNLQLLDNMIANFGGSLASDGLIKHATTLAPDGLYIGTGTESNAIVIGERGDGATALTTNGAAAFTNPTVHIHSADITTATQFIEISHNQTNGLIDVGTGRVSIPDGITSAVSALTTATMTATTSAVINSSWHKYSWTNAMVTALGASLTGDITVATLPARTVVRNVYVTVNTACAGTTTLTVAVGRTSAAYVDYIAASDAKAAANTVYGDDAVERGANLTGYDLPSLTATTNVVAHFIATGANLDQVTTCTGSVILDTALAP